MSIILQINNLSKNFEGLIAVNNLNMQVESNTIHSLIGPNGSGKTTTLNLITGTLKPSFGEIKFNGNEITNLPVFQIARLGICRTFQNIKLFPSMTTLENVMIGGQGNTKLGIFKFLVNIKASYSEEKYLKEKAENILNFLGIEKVKNEFVKNLPYGHQKLVELGRVLMSEPKLILLDEPAAGLNPTERTNFVNILQKLLEVGVSIFLIEHNMDVVMNVSNKITVINFGTKIAEGTPKEIQNDPEVIKAYLGEKRELKNGR